MFTARPHASVACTPLIISGPPSSALKSPFRNAFVGTVEELGENVFWTLWKRSYDPKRKVWFFRTGPPALAPQSSNRLRCRGSPKKLLFQVFAFNASFCKKP